MGYRPTLLLFMFVFQKPPPPLFLIICLLRDLADAQPLINYMYKLFTRAMVHCSVDWKHERAVGYVLQIVFLYYLYLIACKCTENHLFNSIQLLPCCFYLFVFFFISQIRKPPKGDTNIGELEVNCHFHIILMNSAL